MHTDQHGFLAGANGENGGLNRASGNLCVCHRWHQRRKIYHGALLPRKKYFSTFIFCSQDFIPDCHFRKIRKADFTLPQWPVALTFAHADLGF
jgi:hypothetical protein